jgi:dTDP-4-amino-4,6-dideoxygalactose transaminase
MSAPVVPYVDLVAQHAPLRDELLAAAGRVIDHGLFVNGPEVIEFERQMASFTDTAEAVAVANGTAGLMLVLKGLSIGPGDEVITPPNSFLASTSCVELVGATPVFADVGDDLNLDPDTVEAAMSPRTKAIIAVHLTGRPARLDRLLELADRHRIACVEDCAQAIGARFDDRPVGSYGIAGCFSLHPLKTLNALGDGGVVTTNDRRLADWLRQARNHGLRDRDRCDFWSENCRLDTLQAAMLLVKMDHLEEWTAARRANAEYLRRRLDTCPEIELPRDDPREYAVYHTFVVRHPRRDDLRSFLHAAGVESKIHYPRPIHLQPAARSLGYGEQSFPMTERFAGTMVSLPIHGGLSQGQLEYVVEKIFEFHELPPPGR